MTAGLIIAAGSRQGKEPFAPDRKVGSISALARMILLYQQAGIREIAVCGEEETVKKLVPSMNVVFLPCPKEGEMLHYIQTGIGYLQKKAEQILVCHVGVPQFCVETVEALLAAEGTVCVPSQNGRLGHPVLLRKACFEKILSYQGENGLKGAIGESGFSRTFVEVTDPGIFPAEKGSLSEEDGLKKLRLSCRFRMGREDIFYGPGVHQLLLLTRELCSLSEACDYMGISYSKGRKIIKTMEQQLGCPVLHSRQGGKGGGFSQLTREAEAMARRYDAFLKEAEETLRPLFIKHFGDWEN